jgi:hypothetical protein
VPRRQLRRCFSHQPQALPVAIIDTLFEQARRSTTWAST